MSYVKNFSGSVPYSKTVTYGKSETGGSMTVSGSVPVSIQLVVDTSPFDASVIDCNANISALAGSVTALNAAQVAQIRKSADDISSHVTHGFFSMIKSEISQNMAALISKINSCMGLITEKAQQLSAHQKVMEDDYRRVKQRYVEVFQNLDDECYRRVVELDKKAFELSRDIQQEQLSGMQSKQVAAVMLGFNEEELMQLQVSGALLNKRTEGAMQAICSKILQERVYNERMGQILHERNLDQRQTDYVPVVYIEADSLVENTRENLCYASAVPQQAQEGVRQYFMQSQVQWKKADEKDAQALAKAFNTAAERNLLEAEQAGNANAKRIYETIMALRLQDTQVN